MGLLDTQPSKKQTILPPTPPLTASTLTPQQNFNLTPPAPATALQGLGGFFEAQATNGAAKSAQQDQFQADLNTKAEKSGKAKKTALDDYLSGILGEKGQTEATNDAYSQTVDPIKGELDAINQQILAEQHGLRRRIEAIQRNPEGKSESGLAQDIDKAERESIAKQADLSIVQMGIQGRYDSAKEIADRAVAAQLEKQKTRNEALRLNYEENKELFNKDEQRAFESAQSTRERELEREERDLKEISDLSIEALANGASPTIVSKMRQAKTVDEAIAAGGYYIGLFDRRLKEAQIEKALASDSPAAKNMTQAERVALGYAKRAVTSSGTLDQLGKQFTKPQNVFSPFIHNVFKGPERQQFEQAERDFVNAVLRKESGATITPDEFKNARIQYVPQPGDSDAVLEQKRLNREQAADNFLFEAGQDELTSQKLRDPLGIGAPGNPLGI